MYLRIWGRFLVFELNAFVALLCLQYDNRFSDVICRVCDVVFSMLFQLTLYIECCCDCVNYVI